MSHHHGSSTAEPHTISWARLYDPLVWVLSLGRGGRVAALTVDTAEVGAGNRVLDVGTGTGAVALRAAERAGPTGEVIGIDAAPEMVAKATSKARGRTPAPRFEVAPIEDLPFETDSFDRVTAQLMIHHLPEDLRRTGLAEIRRVLKPGGTLAVTEFVSLEDSARAHLLSFSRGRKQHRASWLTALLESADFDAVEQIPTEFSRLGFVRAINP